MNCRTCRLLPTLIVGCLGAIELSTAEAVLIRLKPAATVSSSVIRLADVADIQDADEQQVARLGGITLAPAPEPGTGRGLRLDFEAIRGRLSTQGVNVADVEFSGSSVVEVMAARREAADKKALAGPVTEVVQRRIEGLIAAAITEYLNQTAPQLGGVGVIVKLATEQRMLLGTCGYAKYQATGGAEPWIDAQIFDIHFVDRQGTVHDLKVNCQVTPHPRVLVLKHDVPQGYLIQAEDVAWQQVASVRDRGGAIDTLEALAGQETTRPLRLGEPVNAQDLRGVPLIRRGDIVTVISRSRGITIRMEAKAQGDGSAGQPVALISLDGRQKFTGRVIGYHQAEVARVSGERTASSGDSTGVKFMSTEKKQSEDKPNATGR